eukprot:CAMPEP_0176259570 /NCGR_PEP_ID=MMETSP0121_2-20121125/39138_1 /TAXON_ID=160619 /ORGANISM="Kryptoperidinium foliaceum, Strain CCMP 1326" /LENGTH=85 /DNA_ID=CAMNT_0017599459 /DNA_START=58 /DNA_END=312 /DNA_ORIENTATION=+
MEKDNAARFWPPAFSTSARRVSATRADSLSFLAWACRRSSCGASLAARCCRARSSRNRSSSAKLAAAASCCRLRSARWSVSRRSA